MNSTPDFGPCPCRGGRFQTKFVEIRILAREGTVTIADVPQGHCPNCFSRVYRPDMLAHIEDLYRRSKRSFKEELPQ